MADSSTDEATQYHSSRADVWLLHIASTDPPFQYYGIYLLHHCTACLICERSEEATTSEALDMAYDRQR